MLDAKAYKAHFPDNPAYALPPGVPRQLDSAALIEALAARERRWAAVRKEMDARGLDCLILCGWPAMWDFNIANARYLCPIGGNAEFNVLVFPRAGEPTSFIYSPVFTDYWRGAQNWVSDVRPKRGTFGDSVADRLAELRLTG